MQRKYIVIFTLLGLLISTFVFANNKDSITYQSLAKKQILQEIEHSKRICKSLKPTGHNKVSERLSYYVFVCIVNDSTKDETIDFVVTVNHENPDFPYVSKITETNHKKKNQIKKEFLRI